MRNNIEQRRRSSQISSQQRHKKTPTENDIGEGKNGKRTKQKSITYPKRSWE
jgi:hypothetical protein